MEEDLQRELDRNAAGTRMAMAREVEAQAAKKEAVSALSEHVAIRQVLQQNKLDVVNEELDQEDDNSANAARLGLVKTGLKEHTERMQILQRNMAKNAETMAKREQLKEMLEKQVLLEEKIAVAREKLLEMKMRQRELQKAKMERTRREQEE